MRIPLNCLIVALWLWFRSRGRAYLWVRRSLHFAGLVPHAGTAHVAKDGTLMVVEYVPPKNDLWTRKNMLVLFDGTYRVWEMRPVSVRRFKTMEEVTAWMNGD